MSLAIIKDTVQQVATAITAALELETEIVNEDLMIIGGTGRYREKIGAYEESGDTDSHFVYAECLKSGQEYINFTPENDPFYDAKEGELAEICYPIKVDGRVLGLIGLIAFTEEQRSAMIGKTLALRTFLQSMADLIAGKYIVSQSNEKLMNTVSSLLSTHDDSVPFEGILGDSPAMKTVKSRAFHVASGNSTILLTGESGTGKDLLARSIHRESPRRDEPFVSVNCAAIPEMLLESELFGYEKGAFTGASREGKLGKFQLADGGTLFLDEIGDMPLHLQVKLLSCIQNRQVDPIGASHPVDVDVRIIAATNKDLEALVRANQFREDLYFRLNVIPISIPPLRERREDISVLTDNIIKKFDGIMGRHIDSVSPEAMEKLLSYPWPGNVRELENAIEYAMNMEESDTITLRSLPEKLLRGRSPKSSAGGTLRERMDDAERDIIAESLARNGTSLAGKRRAADELGISESTLYRRIRTLGI